MAVSPIDDYDVVWDSPSGDSSESMPCGGGDIALNVWVENGDVLFYISRSGSLAETNEYLKLGRVRLKLDPNPFNTPGATFKQTLRLREGYVEIEGVIGGKDGTGLKATVRIWAEVHRPIVHVEVESDHELNATATYENWRLEEEQLANDTRRHASFDLMKYPGEVHLSADTVAFTDQGVLFYHRNPPDNWLRNELIKQQDLGAYRDQIADDLSNRTFGGFMTGEGFVEAGQADGRYQTRTFRGWVLKSQIPSHRHRVRIVTHIEQTQTLEQWRDKLNALADSSQGDWGTTRQTTLDWWRHFWERSWIVIHPDKPDAADRAWRVARNYNLFRYQLGCNALGEYPSKFNGGSFTFDANLVGENFKQHGPDWRQWGGGCFTAQNQRLLYWPMLKAGDTDAILGQFELYRKATPGATARVKANFGHDGAVFSEYITVPGIALGMGYGWPTGDRQRGEDIPFGDKRADAMHHYGDPVEKGVMACKPIAYHWESQVEHAYMILEYHRFTGADISRYMTFVESAVLFFNEHFRKRQVMRNGREVDENGHLVVYPAKACESYRGATNPADLIAGLSACLELILTLDDSLLNLRDKAYYRDMLRAVPPLPFGENKGHRVILPAKSWHEYSNAELPQLYPLFPFDRFALGRDDMRVFKDTYTLGDFRKGNVVSWHQDGIFFARMGMTQEAADFNSRKLDDSDRRYPTFWGPGHDWVPDHNWGGSGMIGLQEMLMQTLGSEIRLFPAWPIEWDVDFKLHAPEKTTVQGRLTAGKLTGLVVKPASREKDVVVMPPVRCERASNYTG
ncbi:MAG: hypothetical protein GC164_03970 [Phycisphaera sp.]|nr:hypothetical protein [Phycisphaera sp.]